MSAALVAALQEKYRLHALDIVQKARPLMEEQIKASESRRTGHMADMTTVTDPQPSGDRITVEARVDTDYAQYQDEGTGVYGPTGARIFPKKVGGVLVFDWPAAGGVVFARSVEGAPGRHFFAGQNESRWFDVLSQSLGGSL